ncbi:MAG: hypothetical protein ACRCUP_04765 [Mycoplasmatales bacterium]
MFKNKEYLEDFLIRFTYNTNKIEGNTISLNETKGDESGSEN